MSDLLNNDESFVPTEKLFSNFDPGEVGENGGGGVGIGLIFFNQVMMA
jgi:hypothetical protein